jgi:hypothetical protein
MYISGKSTWISSAVSVQGDVISVEFVTQEEGTGTHKWAMGSWREKNRNGEELHIHIRDIKIMKEINLNQWDLSGSTDEVCGMNPSV